MSAVLAVRLDSEGDVLLAGPAVRALAATCDRLDLLVSPAGCAAAGLLPGVHEVLTLAAPWTGFEPPPADPAVLLAAVAELRDRGYDRAVVFTSFHQSPLPVAVLAALAGIPWVAADCVDYPGSLLALRHTRATAPDGSDVHEVDAGLDLARAAGGRLPGGDGGRLALRRPPAPLPAGVELPARPYVVVHPGASVPARAPRPQDAARAVGALAAAGWAVVVTGGPGETELTREVCSGPVPTGTAVPATGGPGAAGPGAVAGPVLDLGGRTSFGELATVLAGAACVVVGNTGPAHLAAAVGTPVVSWFAPVVPAARWAPYGVPHVLLGDPEAPCRDTRARLCPVPGHPCLAGVPAHAVVEAVARLTGTGADAAGSDAPGADPGADTDGDPGTDAPRTAADHRLEPAR